MRFALNHIAVPRAAPGRVLADGGDRLENVAQIRALAARGLDGPFSFASMGHVAARAGGGT
jgi:predicted xylose isomerase-like sugar epimerase